MLSRRLMALCLILLALFAYLYFAENKMVFAIPAGITIAFGIIIWIFQHQINWAWSSKYPPAFPEEMHHMFESQQPFYRGLKPEDKRLFGERCALFILKKEWLAMGIDEIPEDIKYMVAFYAVQAGWYVNEFLYDGYDRVVFYLHPFLSPHYKEQVHTYEVEHVDGTLIFAIENLTSGFMQPGKYYQTGLHAMAEVFRSKHHADYPGPEVWPAIEDSSPVKKSEVESQTGLNQDDPWPVLVHNWFTFSSQFQERQRELYDRVGILVGAIREIG